MSPRSAYRWSSDKNDRITRKWGKWRASGFFSSVVVDKRRSHNARRPADGRTLAATFVVEAKRQLPCRQHRKLIEWDSTNGRRKKSLMSSFFSRLKTRYRRGRSIECPTKCIGQRPVNVDKGELMKSPSLSRARDRLPVKKRIRFLSGKKKRKVLERAAGAKTGTASVERRSRRSLFNDRHLSFEKVFDFLMDVFGRDFFCILFLFWQIEANRFSACPILVI